MMTSVAKWIEHEHVQLDQMLDAIFRITIIRNKPFDGGYYTQINYANVTIITVFTTIEYQHNLQSVWG